MTTPTPDWDAVIDELNTKGWIKSQRRGPNGEACVLRACQQVTLGNLDEIHYNSDAVRASAASLGPIIREQFPERHSAYVASDDPSGTMSATWRFNDHPDTTKDDVILVCEKARAASPVL